MHTGDLGVVQAFAGRALDELCNEWPGEVAIQSKVNQLWLAIKSKYEENQCNNKLSMLKREMFHRQEDFPILKAKAAESRALLFTLRDICADLHDGSDRDEHRARCFASLTSVYTIFQSADVVLTDAESKSALEHYNTFLLHYNWLLKRSLSQGVRRYGVYYKFHNMWHIVDQSKWLNPIYTWCYDFESFMG